MSYALSGSTAMWLSVWAFRYNADCDYKLNGTAKAVRWTVVLVGYALAASLPGPGFLRVTAFAVGLCFLCWPNFAYHLTKLLVAWPTTTGYVVSVTPFETGWTVTYSFDVGDDRFGGTATVADSESEHYCEGQSVTVRYNPLGPDDSKLVCSGIAM